MSREPFLFAAQMFSVQLLDRCIYDIFLDISHLKRESNFAESELERGSC